MIAVTGSLFSAGCKSKSSKKKAKAPPPPSLRGVEVIPADATAVIGFNLAKLASSKLVQRAIDQMFVRDPGLRSRMDNLFKACKLEPRRDITSLMIALRGGADAVMVVTGQIDDTILATCVLDAMKTDGGTLSTKKAGGRTLYRARRGERDVWFAVAGKGTIAVGTNGPWLEAALSAKPKLMSNPTMKDLLDRVDRSSSAWAAGQVPEAVAQGMVKTTAGTVTTGPKALFGELHLSAGVKGTLGAEMAGENDANALKSFLAAQIGAGVALIGGLQLGPLLRKVTVDSKGPTVYLRVSLTATELEQALGQIDSGGSRKQNSPPK